MSVENKERAHNALVVAGSGARLLAANIAMGSTFLPARQVPTHAAGGGGIRFDVRPGSPKVEEYEDV